MKTIWERKMYKSLATLTITTLALLLSQQAIAKSKVVYHYDSRLDVQDSPNAAYRELAKSTAAQISWSDLDLDERGVKFRKTETLAQVFNICPSERFADQPAMANCSGFLVGPDLLVTAGHCVVPASSGGDQCDKFAWVFDYTRESKGKFRSESVYGCKEVLDHALDSTTKKDYALIRLDRPVLDRPYLEVRTEGEVEVGTDLFMAGHPSGLPTKVADGATVRESNHAEFFKTDLDAFGGNSGSAVMDAQTGVVEGILVRGASDYEYSSKGCYEVNFCEDAGGFGCGGESVSRVTSVKVAEFLYSSMAE
jgi:V8-like Glu-specific endopeptidase